jgi:hypothetical protein
MNDLSAGYVYVLSNPSMPGIVKIGKSIHGGNKRASGLYVTGVPEKFNLEFEIFTNDIHSLEASVHKELDNRRVNKGREFFKISVVEALITIISSHLEKINMLTCWPEEYAAFEAANKLAAMLDDHPLIVADAMRFIDVNEMKKAIDRRGEWVEKRLKDMRNG